MDGKDLKKRRVVMYVAHYETQRDTKCVKRYLSAQTLFKTFNGPESCAQQPSSRWRRIESDSCYAAMLLCLSLSLSFTLYRSLARPPVLHIKCHSGT